MNPEAKAKWVAALRSGEYQQGFAYLQQVIESGSSRYCCLGVLCRVAMASGVAVEVVQVHDCFRFDRNATLLPDVVATWAGLDDDPRTGLDHDDPGTSALYVGPLIPEDNPGNYQSFIELNDDFRLTFNQIADFIEVQL